MTITDPSVDNGVNVQALLGAREALSAAPEAAQFTWRASCTWRTARTAGHRRRLLRPRRGAAAPHDYEFDVDHPECFASEDNGATPVEFVLVGLAGCLTAGVAAVAQYRGIQLRSVTASRGRDGHARHPRHRRRRPQRLQAVRVPYAIDSDATRDDLAALVAQSQKRSAVFDIITNPTKVLVELA